MLNCRSCQSDNFQSIIPLGEMPLANALLKSSSVQNESRHNLEVMLCGDCGLAQLRDLIDPKELFSDYVYFSSNSDTMLRSAADLTKQVMKNIPDDALVMEIASNDGYLLKNYIAKDINVLGIDPAQNIAKIANEAGINTLCDFFSKKLADNLVQEDKKADIIHANNVMAHVPDLNDFIQGIQVLLKPLGKAIIEVPYFLDLVKNNEFDTIYHEHVFYFALRPLRLAFERHGLDIFDVEKLEIHGGSLRLFVGHKDARPVATTIREVCVAEELYGLAKFETFDKIKLGLHDLKVNLIDVLNQIKSEGGKIAAYGASAKGTTLLNYFGIGKELLDFVVDRSPVKQGLYTPGTGLEICPVEDLISKKATHALLLAWNFSEEIMAQQKDFIQQGGKFIRPLPTVEVL
tara:strand:- start:3319 stop:4530 length:1212 start_codon:yes stop_codon:yes gene_type:complete